MLESDNNNNIFVNEILPENKGNDNQKKTGKSHETLYDIKKNIKNEEEPPFSIYQLGKIDLAEKHRSANKPLREILKSDTIIDYCPCCNFPVMQKGILEPFKTCDDPEDFSNCGIGVSLYFSFIKFIILIMLVVSIFIGFINIYYSYKYTIELIKVCNIYYKTEFSTNKNYTEECKYYFTEADEDSEYYSLADTFFFRFSSVNVKDYRDFYQKLYTKKNESFESSIINISLVNFECLFLILIFNLFFIFFLFNKNNSINYQNLTNSDYSIILYDLYDIHERFLNEIKKIQEKRIKAKTEGIEINEILTSQRQLGFVDKAEMKEIDKFKQFIINKICKNIFNEQIKINNIVLCYKLHKLMNLIEELNEKEEKISKVKNDPKQIKMNEDLGLKNEKRKFFKIFLFCKKKNY